MEIASNESSECVVKDEDSADMHNLKTEESQAKDDKSLSPKVENEANIDSESEEKNCVLTIIKQEEHEENDRVSMSETLEDHKPTNSFKIPAVIIGPRRGQPGQSRTICALQTEQTAERSYVSPEKTLKEDDKRPDSSKDSNGDKQQLPLQYKEPSWGGIPNENYKMEVLKSGVILDTIDIGKKSFYVIGRLPTCDVSLAHPTISRYHAVLQYRHSEDEIHPTGYYIYDLGSTHGTFWNGCKIRPNTYVRLQGGHMIRFGCSQRKFIIQTPAEDVEDESEFTVTELKERRRLLLLERERAAQEEQERAEEEERLRLKKEEEEGIDWGMGEDADEETDLRENPYASTTNEELFLDDPKKTLRGWFEREGHELQYQTEEKGIGQFVCWVDLPIDGVGSRTVRAEAVVKGKKKESVVQCALEACRILDRHGVLRQATHEARKRKTKNWEDDDFYDSDEDTFLDRTGTVEKKREQRMRHVGKLEEKVENYASLLEKHTAITKKIADIESQLRKSEKSLNEERDTSNEDALDAFMSNLNSNVYDKVAMRKMKLELQNLRKEEENLLKLVNITRPANLPSLNTQRIPDNTLKSVDMEKTPSALVKKSPTLMKKCDLKREINALNSAEKASTNEEATRTEHIYTKRKKSSELPVTEMSKQEDQDAPSNNTEATVTNVEDKKKNENEIAKKKMRNMKRMQQRSEKAAKQTEKGYGEQAYDEDYSMWLPPENQSGDGKTTLNDKYGY